MRQRRFSLPFRSCLFWLALLSGVAAPLSFAAALTITMITPPFGPLGIFVPPDGALCAGNLICIGTSGGGSTVSGTWLASPSGSEFTTGANWTSSPNAPNWSSGVATFGSSTTTAITIDNAGTYVDLDSFAFAPGAPAYSFTVATGTTLDLDHGIGDNSGNPPNFTVPTGAAINLYSGLSSAGASTFQVNGGSLTIGCTNGQPDAGSISAKIVNNGGAVLIGCAGSSGNAVITTTNSTANTANETILVGGAGSHIQFVNGPGGITELAGSIGSIAGEGTFLIGGISVGYNNLDTTVTGTIANAGTYSGGYWTSQGSLTKVGTGTLILDGVNTYTFGTYVTAGTLVIGDASHSNAFLTGDASIGNGATLMGYGTIGGPLSNSGVLQPAAAGAALRVNGNYSQLANGKLVIAVTPTAAATLAVGGSAALAGTVQFVYAPGTYSAKSYPILTASNGVSGTFDTVQGTSPSSDLTQSVNYGTNEVDLVLAAPAKVAAPVNSTILSNAAAVGTGNASAALDLVFAHLDAGLVGDPGDTIETALSGTAPVKLASNDFVQSAQMSDAMQGIPAAMKRYGGWFRGIGSFNSAHSQGAAPGYHGRSGGFLGGIDRAITPDVTLGIAAGYSHTDFAESDGTSGAIDTPRLLGYGLYHIDGFAIEATLGLAYDRITTARPVPALGANAAEGHNGFEKSAALQAAYPLAAGDFTIVPRAGAQYVRLDENKFAESGADGFDLASGGNSSQSLQPGIGASVLTALVTDDDTRITPEIKVAYARELLGTSRNLVLTTASGSAMNAAAVTPAHNILTLGPRVTAHLTGDLEFVADYTLSLGLGKSVGHTIFAGARKSF